MTRRQRLLKGIAIALVVVLTACRADGLVSPLATGPRAQPLVPGMLAGRVRTSDSLAPLPGAYVQLMSLDGTVIETASADSSGVYAFRPVPPGAYRVRVRAIGFRPHVITTVSIDASTAELPGVALRKDIIQCFLPVISSSKGGPTKRAGGAPASAVPLGPAPAARAPKRGASQRPKG